LGGRSGLTYAIKSKILPALVSSKGIIRRYLIDSMHISDAEDIYLDSWDKLITTLELV